MQNNIIITMIEKCTKSIYTLKSELNKLHINKINIELIDNIKIIYNSDSYFLKHISSLNFDKNILIVKPFDKKLLNIIYKSIIDLNLDLNITVISDYIKISLPQPSEERRKFFIEKINKLGENFKISIRNIRRDAINEIKFKTKSSELSKDLEKMLIKEVEDIVNKNIKLIDDLILKKNQDFLKI